jgi:hypothetical protein
MAMNNLQPSAKTTIAGKGGVVFRDVTVHGLQRMCVAAYGKYPDVEVWTGMLPRGADIDGAACRYAEKIVSDVFVGYLWFYWKEKA